MLVQVAIGAGSNLYSVSADSLVSTTINVTPLTDIITRSWYNAQGVSTDAAFAAPVTYPAPNSTAVQDIQTTVQNVVGLWLTNAGCQPEPISFQAHSPLIRPAWMRCWTRFRLTPRPQLPP